MINAAINAFPIKQTTYNISHNFEFGKALSDVDEDQEMALLWVKLFKSKLRTGSVHPLMLTVVGTGVAAGLVI